MLNDTPSNHSRCPLSWCSVSAQAGELEQHDVTGSLATNVVLGMMFGETCIHDLGKSPKCPAFTAREGCSAMLPR